MSYKLCVPSCRVWRAPQRLIDLLPEESPSHVDRYGEIDVTSYRGLSWLTCKECDWHTDWKEMFFYFVASGGLTLRLSFVAKSEELNIGFDPIEVGRCRLFRGDIVALWPMALHRVSGVGTMAAIEFSNDRSKFGPDEKRYFPPRQRVERWLSRYIRSKLVSVEEWERRVRERERELTKSA